MTHKVTVIEEFEHLDFLEMTDNQVGNDHQYEITLSDGHDKQVTEAEKLIIRIIEGDQWGYHGTLKLPDYIRGAREYTLKSVKVNERSTDALEITGHINELHLWFDAYVFRSTGSNSSWLRIKWSDYTQRRPSKDAQKGFLAAGQDKMTD